MQDIIETKPAKVYRHIFVRKRTMNQSIKHKMFQAIMHYELRFVLEHKWEFPLTIRVIGVLVDYKETSDWEWTSSMCTA